jgi:hypothetical protein
VEGADELAVLDFTERLKVSIAVRATSLHDVSTDFDIGLVAAVTTTCCKLEFANDLSLGTPHSLTRQRFQEVVDVLVELTVAPGGKSARQQ